MKMNKNFLIWALIFFGLFLAVNLSGGGNYHEQQQKLAFSDFMNEAENKHVSEVTIVGNSISGQMIDGTKFNTYAPFDPSMIETLRKNNVKVDAKPVETGSAAFWSVFVSWFPMLLLIGVWVFFFRQANSSNNKAMSFGKSRARLIESTKKVTFADVAGADESKQELEEVKIQEKGGHRKQDFTETVPELNTP